MRQARIGDIVKFGRQYCKVVGFTTINYGLYYVLETKDGRTGAISVHGVHWTGKQFIVEV